MTEDDVRAALTDGVKVRTDLDSFERDQVRELLIHPGFRHLLGMMLGHRQASLMQLENAQVHDMAGAQRLGVLQGSAKAVDILRQNVIDCASVPNRNTQDDEA